MAHNNIHLMEHGYYYTQKRIKLLETEVKFYKELSESLTEEFQNIPEAIEQYSQIDISYERYGNRKNLSLVKLIKKENSNHDK